MKLLLDTHAFIWWDSDPFAPSLDCQTIVEDVVMVTNDPLIAKYPVSVIF